VPRRVVISARVLAGTVAPLAALIIGGCGGSVEVNIGGGSTLNEDDLAAELSQELGEQAGTPPRSVDCPSGVEPEEGKKFDCTGVAPSGQEFVIEVTLNDDRGGFDAFVPPGQFEAPATDQQTQ
jgi:hypothetical protein